MRSEKDLEEFTAYCRANPEQRFWQALRNWSGYDAIWGEPPAGGITLDDRRR